MLTFFRVNDPYRILGIFLLLLLIRLPYWVSGDYLTLPELNWMLLGERLSEGHRLYSGVWDNTGPLSAGVYFVLEWLFNRSQGVYTTLATLLVTYQGLVFNDFLRARKAFRESTYVPALAYVLFASFSFDFFTLSPVLLALTWVLLSFRNAFHKIEGTLRDTQILRTGIYLGIAALFYLPALVFVLPAFYAYMLFASLSPRRSLLLLYGTLLPFLVAFTYFYTVGTSEGFISQYVLAFSRLENDHYVRGVSLLMIAAIALIFFVLSLYKVTRYRRFTIQQTQLQQVMFTNVMAALVSILFVRELAPFHLLMFVPSFAFFATHFLLILKRLLWAEIATGLLVLLLSFNGYVFLFNFFSINKMAHTEAMMVHPTAYDELVAGKKVLVLGDDMSVYRHAKLATPYLNWQLSSKQLTRVDYFDNLSEVYTNFTGDMPDLIIDPSSIMPSISERIPAIRNTYRKANGEDVYVKR